MNYAKNEYTFSYRFNNKTWSLSIWADSPEEAKEKLKAAANAHYDGQIMQRIYVPVKPAWIQRFRKWWSGQ